MLFISIILNKLYNKSTNIYNKIKHYWEIWKHTHILLSTNKIDHSKDTFKSYGSYAVITYSRLGRIYDIYIPYDRKYKNTLDLKIIKDDQEINIKQQPGIPYFVTADTLGVDKIMAYKRKKHIVSYNNNQKIDST